MLLYCTCTGPKNPGNFDIYFCTFALWKLLQRQKFCISFPREPCIPALVIDEMDSSLFTFIATCPKGRYLNTLGGLNNFVQNSYNNVIFHFKWSRCNI